jgi:hypothetical protein
MFEVQYLIPVTDNAKVEFTAVHHVAFEAALLEAFGGFTLLPAEAAGSWVNDHGVPMHDLTRVYIVAVASIAQGDRVAALAGFAKAHYAQEAIFIRYLGVSEII